MRRLHGRCYFCGDPTIGKWFCAAHLWAQGAIFEVDRSERPPAIKVLPVPLKRFKKVAV